MKQTNPGHEFDEAFEAFSLKKTLILCGITNTALELYRRVSLFTNDVLFCTERETNQFDETPVITFNQMLQEPDIKENCIIVLCDTLTDQSYAKRLLLHGYRENIDFFRADMFQKVWLPIWAYGAHKKCYIDYLGHATNWHCSLKCKECSVCIPYFNKKNPDIRQIFEEIDLLFSKVDYVYTYDLTGGESFLFSDNLAEIIMYLMKKYGDRIGEIPILTNATIIPSKKMLLVLQAYKDWIHVQISYYRALPGWEEKYEAFCEALDAYEIPYSTAQVNNWISIWDKEKPVLDGSDTKRMEMKFDECENFCRLYTDGQIYFCGHAYGFNQAFSHMDLTEESLDLSNTDISKPEILEYMIGYQKTGYLEVCKHCKGWGRFATEAIPVAEQL